MQDALSDNIGLSSEKLSRLRKRRSFLDRVAQHSIAVGGICVILSICLIFFYLLYEVAPLFASGSVEKKNQYELTYTSSETVDIAMEEQSEIAFQLSQEGEVTFTRVSDASVIGATEVETYGSAIDVIAKDTPESHIIAAGLDDGSVVIAKHVYNTTYPNDERLITPLLVYPYGDEAIEFLDDRFRHLAVRDTEEQVSLVGLTTAGALYYKAFEKTENFMTGALELSELEGPVRLHDPSDAVQSLHIGSTHRWMYAVFENGGVGVYDLKDGGKFHSFVNAAEGRITSSALLLGGISLLLGDEFGGITQWFPVRSDEGEVRLTNIRDFKLADAPISSIALEQRRKLFIAADTEGHVGFFHTTAERDVFQFEVGKPVKHMGISPRGDTLYVMPETGPTLSFDVDNEHPEVSLKALWGKVWYESYQEPDYVWQSSSASNDFEPKLSLTPLAFGTLKAAFYAMLLAIPLAVCGAIFTAYFMAPELRKKIKPTIELMEALPTVILGFLAGLWLAPLVEARLPGIFAIMLLTPISILVVAYIWTNLPLKFRGLVPEGWTPLLLVPVVIATGWISIEVSPALERAFFGGDIRIWLKDECGIDFDQRNALIVGVAMGFAVIPTIFSITEDALFGVPKNLSFGSLALGATPWQTLVRVILPTASPGIFSAVMIGFGRAVGETMIVLMATGNTPIMDMNIFEGLRTLSANIAVEMPEAEVDSSHFRILFLAGLVLFVFTFILNTTAEAVRQRLREKYGSL